MRRLVAALAAAAAAAAGIAAAPATAASPICDATLFVATDGDTFVVEQPESAAGAVYCDDAPAGSITFTVATPPVHGLLSALTPTSGGGATFSYSPTVGYAGDDSFILKADNGTDPPVLVTVAVSVRAPANDAPFCTATLFADSIAGGYSVEASEPVAGQLDCTDDEDDPLTYAVSTPASHGAVSGLTADGAFTYTPGAVATDDSFALTANDGAATSAPAVVHVTIVTASNEPPVCTGELSSTEDSGGAFEVEQGQSVTALVLCDDDDDDALTFAMSQTPAHGALAALTPVGDSAVESTYTAAANYLGYDQFRVTAGDGTNAPVLVIVRVRVIAPRDDAPQCTVSLQAPFENDRYRVEQGRATTGTFSCSDETSPLAYSVSPSAQHGTVSAIAADGTFTYTADAAATGADTFTLVASDGTLQAKRVVPIQIVVGVNDPPRCEVSMSAGSDATGRFLLVAGATPGRVTCTDDEGDPLTFAAATAPGHGTLTGPTKDGAVTAGFTYTPTAAYLGDDAFTLSVGDGVNAAQSVPVTVAVRTPTPSAPHCSATLHTSKAVDGYEVEVGETVQGTLSCFDPDGDTLTYSVGLPPTAGVVSTPIASGGAAAFTYTAGNTLGADRFELVASDGTHSSNVVSLPVKIVVAVDSPPECSIRLFESPLPSSAYPAENARPNPGIVSCVDDEGGPLTFEVMTPAQHGDIVALTGSGTFATFDYVADSGVTGSDTATVRVRDGANGEDVVTLGVEVGPSANTAPTCTASLSTTQQSGAYVVAAGTTTPGTISCQDTEGDALSFAVQASPAVGSVGALSGTGGARSFTFTAPSGPGANGSFTLRTTDALGAVKDVTIPVTITPTPPPDNPGGGGDGGDSGGGGSGSGSDAGADPGGSSGGGSAGGGSPGGASAAGGTEPQLATELARLKFAVNAKRDGVRLTFTTIVDQSVTVAIRARLKGKVVIVAKATKRFAKAGSQMLDLKLSSAARKTLRQKHTLTVQATIDSTVAGRSPFSNVTRITIKTKKK